MRAQCRWALALFALAATMVQADSYPSRSVRLVVPVPAGGPTDIVARHIAKRLTDEPDQQFIVDNRGGANGTL